MHILGHNPAVWAIVCIGLQDEFFDGREPNREATAKELKMMQYNAQACDILFNGLCPEEFNKISRLENAKEIWDTLIDMHEGTDSVKESKLDVLQSQLDKFKMKDGEGVTEMYSRLALITNEIASLGSEEMTDKFIIKKILRALDGKYDTICKLIQMMPITKISSQRKSLEELLLMRCHLRIKRNFTTNQVVPTKPHVKPLHHQVRNKTSMKN